MGTDAGTRGSTGIQALDQRPLWDGGRDFGLETPRALLNALGSPQNERPSIHVAGTNGKGSVCSFLAAVLRHSGASVGQFTSPHLSSVTERCLIDGSPVSVAELSESVEEAIAAAEACGVDPSFFELVSAASYLEFRRKQVEWMVIETGLGGRLDATNLMARPQAAVICSVSYDHMHILGDTLAKIAGEKAGIIRPGVPLIVGPMEEEAYDVLASRAIDAGAPVFSYGAQYWIEAGSSVVEFADGEQIRLPEKLPLAGSHQRKNAAVAVCTARCLGLSAEVITAGISRARWPGRLEWVESKRFGGSSILLDVGHNEDGISSVLAYLKDFEMCRSSSRIAVVCSILARKEWKDMLDVMRRGISDIEKLYGLEAQFFFTASGHKSAVEPEELAAYMGRGVIAAEPEQAITEACCFAGSGFTVVMGSAYLVGDLRPLIVDTPFRTID